MKILLAIDGSTFSDAAIEEIAQRTWPAGSEIKVLTVIETPTVPTAEPWAVPLTYFGDIEKILRESAEETVRRALLRLRAIEDGGVKVTAEILPGPPRQVILDEAARFGANLIVMGSHGYGAWSRFLLGSVSQSVVTHAQCSVAIVKRPQAIEA